MSRFDLRKQPIELFPFHVEAEKGRSLNLGALVDRGS